MGEALKEMNTLELFVDNTAVLNQPQNNNFDAFLKNKDIPQAMRYLFEQVQKADSDIIDVKQELLRMKNSGNSYFYKREVEQEKSENVNASSYINEDVQESRKIVQRIVETLDKWNEADDMRLQVQYAALVTKKILNIKKLDSVHSDSVKVKVCTLLKNTIRLNAAEKMFSDSQISLFKKGINLILEENVEKKTFLKLNRELLAEGLTTMPSWE